MKLLTCEYNGRTFAAVSDGKMVYEAAPDMYALIKALDGKLPGADMLRGEGTALDRVRLLAPIPEPHQDVVCLGMNYIDHSAEPSAGARRTSSRTRARPCTSPSARRISWAPAGR